MINCKGKLVNLRTLYAILANMLKQLYKMS